MNTLRVVLLVIGIVFVVGVYLFQRKTTNNLASVFNRLFHTLSNKIALFFSRIKKMPDELFASNKEDGFVADNRPVEQLSNEQIASMSNMVANNEKLQRQYVSVTDERLRNGTGEAMAPPKCEELLITLTILPGADQFFSGQDILSACKIAGLQLGAFNIFHRYALVDNKVQITPVCSLVNSFEPGYFVPETMDSFSTTELSLFMQLPGPVDGREAFKILMDVSEKLSLNLKATICDETRSVLTTQTISHLKEKVENYRFKLKMDSLKNH